MKKGVLTHPRLALSLPKMAPRSCPQPGGARPHRYPWTILSCPRLTVHSSTPSRPLLSSFLLRPSDSNSHFPSGPPHFQPHPTSQPPPPSQPRPHFPGPRPHCPAPPPARPRPHLGCCTAAAAPITASSRRFLGDKNHSPAVTLPPVPPQSTHRDQDARPGRETARPRARAAGGPEGAGGDFPGTPGLSGLGGMWRVVPGPWRGRLTSGRRGQHSDGRQQKRGQRPRMDPTTKREASREVERTAHLEGSNRPGHR